MRINVDDKKVFNDLFKVAWDRVVWPYLNWVVRQTDPLDALKANKGITAGVGAVLGAVTGGTIGGTVAVGTLGFWSGIGYSLGFLSLPLAWPIMLALVGAASIGGGFYALLARMSEQDRRRLGTLYAHASFMISHAGNAAADSKKKARDQIKDQLAAMGFKSDEVEELLTAAPTTVDEFDLDYSGMNRAIKLSTLEDVWLSATLAGCTGAQERMTLARLCSRLGLCGAEDAVREKVEKICETIKIRTPAVAIATVYVVPPELWDGTSIFFDQLLAADFSGNAQKRRAEILQVGINLAAAAAAISIVAAGHPEALTIVGEGYAVARAMVIEDLDGAQKARCRAVELAGLLGVPPKDADAFMNSIERVVDGARTEAEIHTKKTAR